MCLQNMSSKNHTWPRKVVREFRRDFERFAINKKFPKMTKFQ